VAAESALQEEAALAPLRRSVVELVRGDPPGSCRLLSAPPLGLGVFAPVADALTLGLALGKRDAGPARYVARESWT